MEPWQACCKGKGSGCGGADECHGLTDSESGADGLESVPIQSGLIRVPVSNQLAIAACWSAVEVSELLLAAFGLAHGLLVERWGAPAR